MWRYASCRRVKEGEYMGEKGRMVRGGEVNSHIFTKKQFAQRVPIRIVATKPFFNAGRTCVV